MTDERSQGHLPPAVFVDLLDDAPVEASWRQHYEECEECRAELASLEQTMALVSEDPVAAKRHSTRGARALATAAAALLAVAVVTWMVSRDVSAPQSVELEELLPPVEDDEEFQLLLAVSEAMGEDLPAVASPVFDPSTGPAADLTPEQRQRFVEKLAEEMRSSS